MPDSIGSLTTMEPAVNAGADVHDGREAVHQLQHQGAAEHHDGHADQQADDHQVERAVRRTGHAQHVVDAHQRVGHHDGLHGTPESGGGGAVLAFFAALVGDQLVGDPQQAQAAHQHQAGDLEQPHHHQRHHGAHGNGADRAPHDGFFLQVLGQAAGGQRDDDGVIAGQHQVDQDDGQQCGPPGGGEQFHESSSEIKKVKTNFDAGTAAGLGAEDVAWVPLGALCAGMAAQGTETRQRKTDASTAHAPRRGLIEGLARWSLHAAVLGKTTRRAGSVRGCTPKLRVDDRTKPRCAGSGGGELLPFGHAD
jgi:hypothetical protein